MTSSAFCRWLLRRVEGVLVLDHCREMWGEDPYAELPDEAYRGQQIVLTTIPLLSGLLSPEAELHLDLGWGMSFLDHLLNSQ